MNDKATTVQPIPFRPLRVQTWVIGHRGFPTAAPENTLASFQKAIDAGADMVELDVAVTRDGIPVVLHDPTVRRTTEGRGSVRKLTLSDVRALDAGRWFAEEFSGERIPLLEEVLDLVAGRICVNIEIKREAVWKQASGGIEEKVLRVVDRKKLIDRTVISSFSPLAVERSKALRPDCSTALLLTRMPVRFPMKLLRRTGADALHVPFRRLKRVFLEHARNEGIPLRVYTVNEIRSMQNLIDWGVDGIFTDRVDRLVATTEELRAR
jgi:glycerophosphoryl diester phosphodiesterase